MDIKYIGQNLKFLRLKHGLNKSEMAEKIGINEATYNHIEKGLRGISTTAIIKVCETFNTTFEFLATNPDVIFNKLPNMTDKEKMNELTYSQLACLTEENCKVIYELANILGNQKHNKSLI